jgi:hypothetical protein
VAGCLTAHIRLPIVPAASPQPPSSCRAPAPGPRLGTPPGRPGITSTPTEPVARLWLPILRVDRWPGEGDGRVEKQNPAEAGSDSAALPHYVSRLEKHRIIESLRIDPLSAAHTPDLTGAGCWRRASR